MAERQRAQRGPGRHHGAPRQAALWRAVAGTGMAGAALLAARGTPPTGAAVAPVGLVATGAVLLGAFRRPPAAAPTPHEARRVEPQALVAAGILALAVSDLAGGVWRAPSGALPAALAGWALLAGGLALQLHDRIPGRALDAVLAAGLGALGAGFLAWAALGGRVDGPVTVALGPPLAGTVATVLAVRLALGPAPAGLPARLIGLGSAAMVVAQGTGVLAATGLAVPAGPPAGAAVCAYALWAAAALHPWAARPAHPVVVPLPRLSAPEVLTAAAVATAGPVAVALFPHRRGAPAVVGGAVLCALASVGYLVRHVQRRAAVEHRAHHDELTGLPNRSLFAKRAGAAMAHARRSGGRVAVMFLDLDRFKHVNDSLGHAAGNQLLAAVARRLRASLGGDATVARLGGDEFAVLLPALDDVARAAGVAGAVLAAFARPFRAGRRELFVSPSIGVALWPDHGPDLDTLLKHADIAMYRAKAAGRNTFCVYDPAMSAGIRERLDLESRLHVAIEREELVLHYQPKVDLRTGRIVGVEALARWHHPTAGLLDPGRFIPLAEETGLIVALGEWVLAEACAQAVRWQAAGLPPLVVAVNVSARQFQHQRVPDVTAAILRATGLAPWLLEFEVTESLALEDPDRTAAMLTDLKEMGVRCAIDDFGTGYSGLSYLERFPIDALKIDKSFVQSIRPGRGAPIVTAVVALAHSLGLRVVAEGVETRAQLDYLREVGCDEMQGYLFSGPLEAAAVARVLAVERALPHNLRPTAPETLLARLSEISAAAPRRRP